MSDQTPFKSRSGTPSPLPELTTADLEVLPPVPPSSSSSSDATTVLSSTRESPQPRSKTPPCSPGDEGDFDFPDEEAKQRSEEESLPSPPPDDDEDRLSDAAAQEDIDAPLEMTESPVVPMPTSGLFNISMGASMDSVPSPVPPPEVGTGEDRHAAHASLPYVAEDSDRDTDEEARPAPRQEEQDGQRRSTTRPCNSTSPSPPAALADEEAIATVTEKDIAASMQASEAQADAALQRFSTALRAKLVEQLIDDAAVAVRQTLQETVAQHGTRARQLLERNRQLEAQMAAQASDMRTMEKAAEDAIVGDLQRLLRIDVRGALRDGVRHEEAAEGERGVSAGGQETQPAPTASLSSPAGEEMRIDELVAAYLSTRGTIELLQRERDGWRRTITELRDGLLAATRENVALTQEVHVLRATTIDLEVHRTALHARGEAEHQCELRRRQLHQQAEEAEQLVTLLQQQVATAAVEVSSPGAAAQETESAASAEAIAAAEAAQLPLRQGPVWDMALRELEEQATIAANARSATAGTSTDAAAAVEDRMRVVEADRDAQMKYAAQLHQEGEVLRSDLRSLVYRNSVLSQQVASLLVKVERFNRANRLQQQQRSGSAVPSNDSTPPPEAHRASKSILLQPNAELRRRTRGSVPAVPPSHTSLVAESAHALTSLPHTAARRQTWLSTKWGSSQRGSSVQEALRLPRNSTAVEFAERSTEVEGGVQRRITVFSESTVSPPRVLRTVEMEGQDGEAAGVSRVAATSTHGRRVTLRQLGSSAVEVRSEVRPRLPASEQLSGYALGRPPAFTSVNPLEGTVSRHSGQTSLTVARNRSSQAALPALASGAAPPDAAENVEDMHDDPDLLRMLDMIDKDESLDRFSVHSVAELVVRNQELVKQLYEVTQRAEVAEHTAAATAEAAVVAQKKMVAQSNGDGAKTPRMWSGSDLPYSLRVSTEEQVTGAVTSPRSTNTRDHSRKRAREDDREKQELAAEHLSTDATAVDHARLESTSRSPASPGSAAEAWFIDGASAAVSSMVDAIARQQEVRLSSIDHEVSRALLTALDAQRTAAATTRHLDDGTGGVLLGTAKEDNASTTDSTARAMAVCLRSLLQLCVQQSASLAEAALSAAGEQHDIQRVVTDTWTNVQTTLLDALETSRAALASPSTSYMEGRVSEQGSAVRRLPRSRRELNAGSVGTVVAEDSIAEDLQWYTPADDRLRPEDQVALLRELSSLLQTAARKDGTLLHVYQAAHARQEARQHEHKEQMGRMLLKLEKKRRIIKALRFRQSHHAAATGAAAAGASPALGAIAGTGVEGEVWVGAGESVARMTPPVPSPVTSTPPLPPMSLPSSTQPGSPPPPSRQRRTRSSRGATDDEETHDARTEQESTAPRLSDVNSDDEDEDKDDDGLFDDDVLALDVFRELQQQLALSQANYRSVQQQLDEEKAQHTTLLNRMWALEASRDEAVVDAEERERQVHTMVEPEKHQRTAAQLQHSVAELTARDAELASALAEKAAVQEQLTELQTQYEAVQKEAKAQVADLDDAAERRERRLITEQDRCRTLLNQLTESRRQVANLENEVALAQHAVRDKDRLLQCKDDAMAELKSEVLLREDAQVLLMRLYPDNTAIQANAQLVQRLSRTTQRLQNELADAQQALAQAKEEEQQRDLLVREAVQDRQAAEARLQDAMDHTRFLEAQEGGTDTAARAYFASSDRAGTTAAAQENGVSSPTSAAALEALLQVEDASVAALRQRVQHLKARVEAQAHDLAVLREAEAAWRTREDELRQQLQLLSADPVSMTARKYGLTTCLSFNAQLEEMAQRQAQLRAAVAAAAEAKTSLETALTTQTAAAERARSQYTVAQAEAARLESELADAQEQCQNQSVSVAEQESRAQRADVANAELRQRYAVSLEALRGKETALGELQDSLESCTAQRDRFLADNQQMISAVERLEKELVQSESEKKMAREALAQGLSSPARRHRGRPGDRTAASGYGSLTQDVSLSSLTPNR